MPLTRAAIPHTHKAPFSTQLTLRLSHTKHQEELLLPLFTPVMGPIVATSQHTPLFSNPLADFLSNSLVFRQTTPYLPVPSLYALAATCKALHHIVYSSPECFRYLDLSPFSDRLASGDPTQFYCRYPWEELAVSARNAITRTEDYLTHEQAEAAPFLRIFQKLEQRQLLQNVRTMVLDGLPVTPDLVQDIITQDRFNVHILSIRDCKMNERRLMQVLRHAVRPSRPTGTPRVKGIYYFGPRESGLATLQEGNDRQRFTPSRNPRVPSCMATIEEAKLPSSQGPPFATDGWYKCSGRMIARQPTPEWADTLATCAGIIAFDAVLCRGPRHDPTQPDNYLPPAVATVALGPSGCDTCHSSPEGPAHFGRSPGSDLPLLSPVPLHSSTVRVAQMPSFMSSPGGSVAPPLYARCLDCLRGRWCERCQKWWDESCYTASAIAQRTELTAIEFIEYVADNGEKHVVPKEIRKVIFWS